MTTTLYPYQKEGVKEILRRNGRVLLADEMGLGKTLQALWYLKIKEGTLPALVVCPASLKWVWQHEAKMHCNMIADVLEGRKPYTENLLVKSELVVINYEVLSYWLPWIYKQNFSTLIIDECHYQKNSSAIRTKCIQQIGRKIPHVIAISGTPLVNKPSELYTTLHLLWPKEFTSFWSFGFEYCKPSKRPWGWEFKGATNLDKLHDSLNRLGMVRRLKKDVLKDLPDKIREVIPLEISKPKEYKKAKDDFLTWLATFDSSKVDSAMRAEKLVQLGYLKRLAAKLKMDSVLSWVDDFLESNDGKLVLFCTHRSIIKALHEKYGNISVVVDGSVTGKKRQYAVESFQSKPKIKLFIGNIRAAGVGLTLTAASYLAFVELDWTPGNHTQAEDRIHRIGQKNTSNIYYLIAKGTIEEPLCKLIQKKQETISTVLDGGKEVNRLSLMDLLEEELKKGN